MHVVLVTSEIAPYSNSGSLGEYTGQICRALRRAGADVSVIAPFYRGIAPERHGLARRLRRLEVPLGDEKAEVGLLEGQYAASDAALYLLDHPETFQRPGYYGEAGKDYPDNGRRFYLLCAAALQLVEELELRPDVIHCHDWQAGFVPLLRQLCPERWPSLERTRTVFTVHNPAFAGLFQPELLDELGLGRELFHPEGVEFHGRLSLLKAGLLYSDRVITLGRGMVEELQTDEFGFGFQGLFRTLADKLVGIPVGVDNKLWDPGRNYRLAQNFTVEELEGKAACKAALQQELGLAGRADLPLFLVLGPLTAWRGTGLLLGALEKLDIDQLQVAFVGPAEDNIAGRIASLAQDKPRNIAHRTAQPGADDLHPLLAGADLLVHPARYEPGSQIHLRAMRYGAVPLLRRVGAARDTVVEFDRPTATGNGLTFAEYSEAALLATLQRAMDIFATPERFRALTRNAMSFAPSWQRTATLQQELLQQLAD